MEKKTLNYYAKIRVYHEGRGFGPGVARLMSLVQQYGSISAACKEMGMAYSKAWKIIRETEKDLGFPLMEGTRGGEHGGCTVFTEQGAEFLKCYMSFSKEADQMLDTLFQKHFCRNSEDASS